MPIGSGRPSVTLRITPDLEIQEVSGEVETIFGVNAVTLWRQPVGTALPLSVASAVQTVIVGARQGGKEPQICSDGSNGELMVSARLGAHTDKDSVTVSLYRLSGEAEWWEQAEAANAPDGQFEKDDFLDKAAMAFADGSEAAMTMVQVHGGLEASSDQELGRVVQETARQRGATGTARLGNAHYGILHSADLDDAALVGSISDQALEKGVIADREAVAAERIESDGAALPADQIRAVLSQSASGMRGGLLSGLRRIGLGARHDEAKQQVAKLLAGARRAIRQGDLLVESRPILSLAKQAVAMRQVRAHPVIDGRPVDPDAIAALGDAPDFARDLELATIEKALDQQVEWKIWKAVSLRVAVSIGADNLNDASVSRKIGKMISRRKISDGKLLLRPFLPLGGDMAGRGDAMIRNDEATAWRTIVPDFYAFLKGDSAVTGKASGKDVPDAYIEVAADRFHGLAGQKDGAFLVRSLIRTWRQKGIEVIATATDSAGDFDLLKDLEVRYAKGTKIGGWSAG
ncbi:hypothetical protein [Minwuia sp.]|uniref:hypothetical protein n=1 Tax=Minwuia sp. TaxID=2493630 RepID=UPI003A93C3D9